MSEYPRRPCSIPSTSSSVIPPPVPFERTSPAVSSRLEQTMWTGEVSIGAVEGYLEEIRPYVGPSLRSK